MKEYIPFDYLYGRAEAFPLSYKLVYLKIIEDAPLKVIDDVDDGDKGDTENDSNE